MGAAVGKECALLDEVCGWVNAKATVPVWAKMTPNVTDITEVSITPLAFHKAFKQFVCDSTTLVLVCSLRIKLTVHTNQCFHEYTASKGGT